MKSLPVIADIRDTGSIPALERFSGGGHGNPPVLAWRIPRRETWQAIVHRVENNQAQQKQLSTHAIAPKKREILCLYACFFPFTGADSQNK